MSRAMRLDRQKLRIETKMRVKTNNSKSAGGIKNKLIFKSKYTAVLIFKHRLVVAGLLAVMHVDTVAVEAPLVVAQKSMNSF